MKKDTLHFIIAHLLLLGFIYLLTVLPTSISVPLLLVLMFLVMMGIAVHSGFSVSGFLGFCVVFVLLAVMCGRNDRGGEHYDSGIERFNRR